MTEQEAWQVIEAIAESDTSLTAPVALACLELKRRSEAALDLLERQANLIRMLGKMQGRGVGHDN